MKTIVFPLDETGSMEPHRSETIQSFNKYLADLKASEGASDARFSLTLFNSGKMERRFKQVPLADVADLSEANYKPQEGTPLYDAIGRTVSEMEGEALMVVLTDGLENASHEYSFPAVKALIERKKTEDHWEFLFLASSLEVAAAGMGIVPAAAVTPTSSPTHAMGTAALSTQDYMAGRQQRVATSYASDSAKGEGDDPAKGWKTR